MSKIRVIKLFIPLVIFLPGSSAESRNLLQIDKNLSFIIQGSNRHLVMDIANESFALGTPLVETGTLLNLWNSGNRYESEMLATALIGTNIVAAGLKYIFRRERPERTYQPRLWNTRITPSFPSGHTSSSTAFATVLLSMFPETKPLMLGFAFLSGFSQVYTGNHYASDVLAGWLIGVVIGKLTYDAFIHQKPKIESSPPVVLKIVIPL